MSYFVTILLYLHGTGVLSEADGVGGLVFAAAIFAAAIWCSLNVWGM